MASQSDIIAKKSLSDIDNLKTYLLANYSNLAPVKIIENVGDFSHLIKLLQFNEFDLNITIQIPNDSDIRNSIVIVGSTKNEKYSEDKLNKLREFVEKVLRSQLEENAGRAFNHFFKLSYDYVKENFDRCDKANKRSPVSNKKLSNTNLAKKNEYESTSTLSSLATDGVSEKKCSMKTAGDVIGRIQWDEEINKEFIIVGYLDRFLGIKESQFNSFFWGDLVDADYGALAIPEHRISYFKYKNEIIWHKETRLDNVFGSTGSNVTMHQIVDKLRDTKYNSSITSFNDGIILDEDLEEDSLSMGKVPFKMGRSKPSNNNNEPNYFISIPITRAEIKENLFNLTCDLMDSNDTIEKFLLPDRSYHLTVCTLRIEKPEQLNQMEQVFDELKKDEEFMQNHLPIDLEFEDVAEFYNKVFYVKCKSAHMSRLESLKNVLLERMKAVGINLAGNYYEFVPHLTIFKITNANAARLKTQLASKNELKKYVQPSVSTLVSQHILKKYSNFYFGKQSISELALCKMVNIYDFKSYPIELVLNFN